MSRNRNNIIKDLINSTLEKKVRVRDLLTGDVVLHSMCVAPMYVERRENAILLFHIYQSEDGIEVRWTFKSFFTYGVNCQMWVTKKISSRPKQ